jgi:hypothetical protein
MVMMVMVVMTGDDGDDKVVLRNPSFSVTKIKHPHNKNVGYA